jgi:acyl carrier protein
MDHSTIAEDLNTFIRTKFEIGDDETDFDMDVHLFDYGYIDSFGAVELTSFVEDKFSIQISNTDLVVHPMNTINEIAEFVAKRQGGEI